MKDAMSDPKQGDGCGTLRLLASNDGREVSVWSLSMSGLLPS